MKTPSIRTLRRAALAALLLLCGAGPAAAQYYTWGADPASLRWQTIRTPEVQIIYPDTVDGTARRTLFYIGKVHPYIDYGFRHPALRIPFVLHPENFESNGLVMWLPKRVEFLTTPAVESYSMPWIKQLVAHEYRHAVQYNNLNRGTIRALSYLLGQQGSAVGLAFMPVWAIEGDAVMSETQMSSFGRGLQPSFTIEYRAIDSFTGRRNIDRWFCGSYREHIPDHYRMGYQICSYAYTRYGENIWDKVAWYASRNPYLICSTSIALRKFYRTNSSTLFRDTFTDLRDFWQRLPAVADSVSPLVELPEGNYTTYAHPLVCSDTTVVALKSDLDRTSRFVAVNPATGAERTIARTGTVSTRPAAAGRRIWWTEYRRSKLFQQRVNSQLCYLDLDEGQPRSVAGMRNVLYPTAIDGGHLAWTAYTPDGRYTVATDRGERFAVPEGKEIHGLAWDDLTRALYVLVTDDTGMWIARIDAAGLHPLTRGAYITLSDLRAGGGHLYFGSIVSGKDEAHMLDLTSSPCGEYRLTESAYGAFSPAPADSGSVVVTTYDRRGYRLARQPITLQRPVRYSQLPANIVNPPRTRWQVINLDTVSFTPEELRTSHEQHPSRRYRKVPHLLKLHSWAPAALNPFDLIDEHNVEINAGVTLLSQNLLSSAEGYLSYGWNRIDGSMLRGGLRYYGLGVNLDLEGAYGGDQMIYSIAQTNPDTGEVEHQKQPIPDRYHSVSLTATLPLLFEQGYHTRQLTLSAGWSYSNGMITNVGNLHYDDRRHSITNLETVGYRQGLHKLSFSAGFSDQVRMAHRDFLPRWGYLVSAGYALNPSNRHFSDLVSCYVRLYLPGFLPHNSLKVAAAYQTSIGGFRFPSGQSFLGYKSTRLLPRGYTSADILSDHYSAASVDYELPLCYPDGGIPSVLYFKRIRLNVGFDGARYRYLSRHGRQWRYLYAYGGDLTFDVNVFRQPASATSSVTLSLYKPRHGSAWFSASFGLPF